LCHWLLASGTVHLPNTHPPTPTRTPNLLLVPPGSADILPAMNHHQPEIALLISTYQRPGHLRRALQSAALQQGVEGKMELVVTDDGSTDETPQVVADFAKRGPFRVPFTTHPHETFQLSRCRNDGVRASTAPYLLFLDGDCALPRDHVAKHLQHRQKNTVVGGDCLRIDEATSRRIDEAAIASGEFVNWAPESEVRRMRKLDRTSRFYRFIHHPTKPKIIGNNVGIWRSDYERVNGYDENFQGWGCEDDDLRQRLRRAGVRVKSILRYTYTYHLWHPTDVTAPVTWRKGANVAYLLRKGGLTRCRNGLEKRSLDDLNIRVVGRPIAPHPIADFVWRRFGTKAPAVPEVEIVLAPGEGRFSGRADCNVLVALDESAVRSPLARKAHLTIFPQGAGTGNEPAASRDPVAQLEQALAAVA
jgi:glycosyltransferase involved in cell wall biosynthesis